MVFTVTVAANPFHCGVIAACFQYDGAIDDVDQYCRAINPQLCTNLPHVRLDIAESTMCQLRVPWNYPWDYMQAGSALSYPLGVFGLNQVLGAPTLVSSAAPTYRVLMHLEDLELIGSYPMEEQFITPQSGMRAKQPSSGSSAMLGESKGMLSHGLNVASQITGYAGSLIPSMSAISGPTSWALRLASRTAAAFGYSKPRDASKIIRHFRTDYVGENNVDFPTPAYSLAATAENSLRVDETMPGTEEDAMSLQYVLGKYSQLHYFVMTTSQTINTRLWACDTTPSNFWFRSRLAVPVCSLAPPLSSNTANAILPTGLMYWSQFFRQWRGGMKFRFTFAKNKFYAGRVIVGFVPYSFLTNGSTPNNTTIPAVETTAVGPQPFSYTEIWDLKDSNTFEFTVPYMSPYLWTGCNCSTGGVTLTVYDPLITNGESSTAINVLVEVAACDDFEFAVPCSPSMAAFPNQSPVLQLQSGLRERFAICGAPDDTTVVPPEEEPIVPQSTLGVVTKRSVAEYTTGEAITSLKQLLMLPTQVGWNVAVGQDQRTTLPLFMYTPRVATALPMASTTTAYFLNGRQVLISTCFAYYQGTTNYDIYTRAPNTLTRVYYTPTDGGVAPPNSFSLYSGGTVEGGLKVQTGENSLHVQAPTYGWYPRLSMRRQYLATDVGRNFAPGGAMVTANNTYAVPTLQVATGTVASRIILSVSAGDDARLATYLGPPPIIIFGTAQSVSPWLGTVL
jgi:hypothetical protein